MTRTTTWTRRFPRRTSRTLLASLLFLVACDEESVGPEPLPSDPVAVGAVVGSVDLSLTVFPVDDPSNTRTIGLGPAGTPVSVAARGRLAAVPLGVAPAVAIVDLVDGMVLHSVALDPGSGATGVAFANDSVVVVANSDLGTVTPVNARAGTAGQNVTVGTYPQNVLSHEGRIYVVNGNLVNFAPAGPSSLSVLNGATFTPLGTVALSGTNATAIGVGPDGFLYVLHAGTWGQGDGSVSVVSTQTLTEVAHHTGFGDFPTSLTFGPDGTLYTSSFSYGVAAWDVGSRTFTRAPDNAIHPGGVPSTAGLGTDADGRIYALEASCTQPDRVHRLSGNFSVEASISVGICPTSIRFTELPGS